MNIYDPAIENLKVDLEKKLLAVIESGTESGNYKMKDVARFLGISRQVASKLVSPTSPRTLTAFELFRFSVLIREPVTNIVTPEMYMTPDELNDPQLRSLLGISSSNNRDLKKLSDIYLGLPETGKKTLLCIAQVLTEAGFR